MRSTPLPDVPTVTPVTDGTIQVAFVGKDASANTLNNLESALENTLTIDVEVVNFDTMAEARAAICDGSNPTLAWVDAFTYAAAETQCAAIPHLGIELSALETRRTNFEIIYSGTLAPAPVSFSDLADKIWCRVDAHDTISWVYPALTMQAGGFNPILDLGNVVDVEDYSALVLAVYDGTCDMGAIPEGTLRITARQLERDNRQDEETTEELIIDLAGDTPDIAVWLDGEETWEPVPNEVFVSPDVVVLPASIQDEVVSVILDIAGEEDSILADILTYQTIEEKTARDYRNFRQWLNSANWSLSQ